MSDLCCDDLTKRTQAVTGGFPLLPFSAEMSIRGLGIVWTLLFVTSKLLDDYEERLSSWATTKERDPSFFEGLRKSFEGMTTIVSQTKTGMSATVSPIFRPLVDWKIRKILGKYEDLYSFIRSFSIPPGEKIGHEELMRSVS